MIKNHISYVFRLCIKPSSGCYYKKPKPVANMIFKLFLVYAV